MRHFFSFLNLGENQHSEYDGKSAWGVGVGVGLGGAGGGGHVLHLTLLSPLRGHCSVGF